MGNSITYKSTKIEFSAQKKLRNLTIYEPKTENILVILTIDEKQSIISFLSSVSVSIALIWWQIFHSERTTSRKTSNLRVFWKKSKFFCDQVRDQTKFTRVFFSKNTTFFFWRYKWLIGFKRALNFSRSPCCPWETVENKVCAKIIGTLDQIFWYIYNFIIFHFIGVFPQIFSE